MAETDAAFCDRIAAEIADIEAEWEALPPGEAVATSDPIIAVPITRPPRLMVLTVAQVEVEAV
jgi:hypothetical protein